MSTYRPSYRSDIAALLTLLVLLFTFTTPLASCSMAKSFEQYDKFCIIQDTETPTNEHWAHYLYTHLRHRCQLPELLTERNSPGANTLVVRINFDPDMGRSYRVDFSSSQLTLSAGNKDVMLWLCYQFISKVAESDRRFNATDLPPAAIEMDNTSGEMTFEFRGISSPSNNNEDLFGVAASHSVDYHWALWGHNLRKIIKQSNIKAGKDIYAEINGQRDTTQLCFSSKTLYSIIEDYIADQWGEGDANAPERFTIMPMDNRHACTCSLCTAAGNTADNATPAVTDMVVRLANRFPKQMFFTTAYITTRKRPTQKLPDNVGVLISAMDLPMTYDFKSSPEFSDFDSSIKAWQQLTSTIYIWDYARNFDDYLTPYPCLNILQQRILYYQQLGVKGILINGSEDKYSTLDDMQTATIQALLTNPELDIDKYTRTYLHRFYPKTADIIGDYYSQLEDKVKEQNIVLPYYGGIEDELAYIDINDFETFRTTLDSQAKQTTGDERTRLNKMLTALSFTSLEVMRLKDNPVSLEKAAEQLEILSGYESFADMQESKEALGSLETYIEQWKDDTQNAIPNPLLGTTIQAQDKEQNAQCGKLTDGRLGFYSDYHTCWVLSRQPWQLTLPPISKGSILSLSLLVAPAWHIWQPQQIEILQNNKVIATWTTPSTPTDKSTLFRSFVEININAADKTLPIIIKMEPVTMERATIACDEITVY